MFEAIATIFGAVLSVGIVLIIFILTSLSKEQRITNDRIEKTNNLLLEEIKINAGQSEKIKAHEQRIGNLETSLKSR